MANPTTDSDEVLQFREVCGLSIGEFAALSGHRRVLAAVSTRAGGVSEPPFASLNVGLHVGDRPEAVVENRRLLCCALDVRPEWLVVPEQVHGAVVERVGVEQRGCGALELAGAISGADGLVTDANDVPLVAFSSDCPLIFLYDPVRPAIGLMHAGWRGTVGRIAQAGVRRMRETFGTRPEELLACVAPSVGPCCYEVKSDVVNAARAAALPVERLLVRRGDSMYFDLWEANRLQLVEAEVRAEHIAMSGLCTACHVERFYSLRGEGGSTGRFAAITMLRAKGDRANADRGQ